MNCAKLCSSGMPLVRRDAVKVFLSNPWSPARSSWCHFSKRNRENKYPVCGPIRVRIGTDEPHPSEAKNLAQRLEEIRLAQSPQRRVDIGLPESASAVVSRQERVALEGEKRKSAAAKSEEFDALSSETKAHLLKEWMRSSGASQLKELGDHYGIFRDLFGDEYFFYPRIHWRVQYSQPDHESPDCEVVRPVYFGNYLKPSEASAAPEITIETTDPESLWCVLMTGPDGHFTQEKSEYVHYLVGNIKGSEASTGEVVASYLQPFPAKGTGFQRYVFLLFKQDGVIDFSQWKKKDGSYDLSERTFSTLDFYAELQDKMTPASFSFFQATYDRSLRKFFQEKLEMREPVYEYDFPPPNYRPQVKYPISYSFNEYLDRYKHPQQINKEVLLLRLKDLHPFEGEPKPLRYPLAHKTPWNMPSWLKQDLADRALKEGKYKDL